MGLRKSEAPEWVLVERMECRVATPLALMVIDDQEIERWCPRSQIHRASEVNEKFTKGDLIVAGWWAKKEGLDGDPYEPF